MFFVEVECTYALFKSQERFINFSAINFGLLVSMHRVSSTLTACQIYEANLAIESAIVF